jgi:hypothetical protein
MDVGVGFADRATAVVAVGFLRIYGFLHIRPCRHFYVSSNFYPTEGALSLPSAAPDSSGFAVFSSKGSFHISEMFAIDSGSERDKGPRSPNLMVLTSFAT